MVTQHLNPTPETLNLTQVLREFYLQSEREAREDLPQTAFMKDLDNVLTQAKLQLGFLNFVVEPLWCV